MLIIIPRGVTSKYRGRTIGHKSIQIRIEIKKTLQSKIINKLPTTFRIYTFKNDDY